MKIVTAFMFALACESAAAQVSPEDVTSAQISSYQAQIEVGCVKRGTQRGDPPTEVQAFCKCMMQTLKADVAESEWKAAYLHATRHEDAEEFAVIKPYLGKVSAACKAS